MRITVKDKGTAVFDPNRHRSILDAIESAGIPARSMCRDGFCHECKVALNKGTVRYFADAFTDDLEGEILPCTCRPAGDIEIEQLI